MNHDHTTDPADPADSRLAALYRAHATTVEQPSAAGDDRILALARAAVAKPAANADGAGWKKWLNASWFGPGLAFATLASLTVIVVSVMPKEDMSVEREIANAPGVPAGALPAAGPAGAGVAPAGAGAGVAPAKVVAETSPARDASGAPAATATRANESSAAPVTSPSAAPVAAPRAASAAAPPAPRVAVSRVSREAALPAASVTAPPAVQAAPSLPVTAAAKAAPAATLNKSIAPPAAAAAAQARAAASSFAPNPASESATAVVPAIDVPNPFPAQSPAVAAARADRVVAAPDPRPAPVANAGALSRLEKPSLLSAPSDPGLGANQPPAAEVRDAVPTYPNETKSSLPLPYSYPAQRPTPRAAAPGLAAANGALTGGAATAQQQAPARREAVAERVQSDKMAAASSARDPAEWIKAIQKLRVEGKSEQVTRELAEFRRLYPLHPLPDELKALVK